MEEFIWAILVIVILGLGLWWRLRNSKDEREFSEDVPKGKLNEERNQDAL